METSNTDHNDAALTSIEEKRRLYIGNLDKNTTVEDLVKLFNGYDV
jgi:RNA recognition motif-containing protein